MKYAIRYRHTCRICGSNQVKRFLHFDNMPFTDDFVSVRKLGSEFLAPLDIYWCANCKTSQTLHDVEVFDYYRDYRYTVSNSAFAQRFMELLSQQTFRNFALQPGDSVIEVGSGDGYQLSCFQKLGAKVLGFEPSADLTRKSLKSGIPVVQCLFDSDSALKIPRAMQPVQVVLLTYTFDHLPEPVSFLQTIRDILDPERGVLIIEVHDLQRIIERREICLFEQEHTIYLNILTMKRLLQKVGFKLLSTKLVPEVERRGNSLLVAASTKESKYQPDLFINHEAVASMDEWSTYVTFVKAVQKSLSRLREYVHNRNKAGKRLAGYGAGGRGVMTLAMAGLSSSDISYLCDRNQSLHGLYTPRSHIPVVSPDCLLEDPVDEVIVFSFGYLDEIKQQLSRYINRGGRLVSLLELT